MVIVMSCPGLASGSKLLNAMIEDREIMSVSSQANTVHVCRYNVHTVVFLLL